MNNTFPNSSTSSSSQSSIGLTPTGSGLMRYGSAPSSLLSSAVDSVTREFSAVGPTQTPPLAPTRFFPSEASEPKLNVNDDFSRSKNNQMMEGQSKADAAIGLQRSYGFSDGGGGGASSSLVRHSSSPAGFLNHLAAAAADSGFSISRGLGSSYNSKGIAENSRGISRLNSQLSFTRPPKEALSRISEETEHIVANGINADNGHRKATHSYASGGFDLGLWDDSNALTFSVSPNKQPKTGHVNISGLDTMESHQFQFGVAQGSLDMSTMDKLLNIPQDSVPCKIRAKRGCATHPRSIAERERRTRISGKLKKLQDLVPNMDKQTSYADMLDLAVQHIKTLQDQVQKLHTELDSCTCGCKKKTNS